MCIRDRVCAYAAPYEGNFIKSLKVLGNVYKEKGDKMVYAFPESARNILWCKELEKHTDVYLSLIHIYYVYQVIIKLQWISRIGL